MKEDKEDVTEEIPPEPEIRRFTPPSPAQAQDSPPAAGYTTRQRGGLDNAARSVSAGGNTTMFQPGVLVDDALKDPPQDQGTEDTGTQIVRGEPRPPKLQLTNAPFFLIVGAPPGQERLPILQARTTFGRDRGDIQLEDKAVSSLHFQLDVVGREFFIRDLGSRNGTQLNGYPVRYNEILPGDEVRAGETVLVFRTEDDGLTERRPT